MRAETDTIDVWHVHYNGTKIKEFNSNSQGIVKIDSKKIRPGDKIMVRHIDDTPCDDCTIFLFVTRGKKELVIRNKGEGKPLEFSLMDLLKLPGSGKGTSSVYYSSSSSKQQDQRKLLFTIQLI